MVMELRFRKLKKNNACLKNFSFEEAHSIYFQTGIFSEYDLFQIRLINQTGTGQRIVEKLFIRMQQGITPGQYPPE